MTAPLMMIGPGGDYVTRFDVKGDSLVKTRTQQTAGQDRDAESSGSGVAWGLLGRRRKKQTQPKAKRQASDRFEHTAVPNLPAIYAKPAAANLQQQLAMIHAIEHWLGGQAEEIDRLDAIQAATETQLARPAEAALTAGSNADVRVIRFNSKTVDLARSAPSLVPEFVPEPCHAFATDEQMQAEQPDNPNPLERSVTDDQPQPHTKADENFDVNSRHPAIARLFADDERARRSARRLQSNHLRTRRSTHQKGLPRQGCEQGALFGAVA